MHITLLSKIRRLRGGNPVLGRWLAPVATRLGAASFLMMANAAQAAAGGGGAGGANPSEILNKICEFILGPFGQTLAVLGIIAIGVSWMFGRASLGLIAGVIGGIVIMFGASFIGQTLTGGGAGGAG